MLKKRGRPKEPKEVVKLNPINVHISPVDEIHTSGSDTTSINISEIAYKCDTARCNSPAKVFINLKYCPSCAKDKGF